MMFPDGTRQPLPARRAPAGGDHRYGWAALYLAVVAVTALFDGWLGLLAASGFLALGFWAGRAYQADRDH